jgi:hypothetical protein
MKPWLSLPMGIVTVEIATAFAAGQIFCGFIFPAVVFLIHWVF